MRQYTAYYNDKKHVFSAENLSAAADFAVAHFKVPRSKRGLLSVILSDVPLQDSNADFG